MFSLPSCWNLALELDGNDTFIDVYTLVSFFCSLSLSLSLSLSSSLVTSLPTVLSFKG